MEEIIYTKSKLSVVYIHQNIAAKLVEIEEQEALEGPLIFH